MRTSGDGFAVGCADLTGGAICDDPVEGGVDLTGGMPDADCGGPVAVRNCGIPGADGLTCDELTGGPETGFWRGGALIGDTCRGGGIAGAG